MISLSHRLTEIQLVVLRDFRSLVDSLVFGLDCRSAAHIICDPELFFEVERYRERKPLQAPLAFKLHACFATNRSQYCVAQTGQPQISCHADRKEIFVQGKAINQKPIRAGCARLLPQ